jgi:pimeloyl-ACP methyl ester carboxylesterase
VRVPIDYARPRGPALSLAVIRRPATDPAGSLGTVVFNPGGPGESGVSILPILAGLLPPTIAARFDLVSFDERGTGASRLLDCGPSPVAAAAVAPFPAHPGAPLPAALLYAPLERSCAAADPALLAHMGTADSARDMDRVRQALGLLKIDYYGLSYGTVLGAVYAHMFGSHLRTLVLDGAVLPTLALSTQAVEEAPAVEASLHHWFVVCAAAACVGRADPDTLYRSVADRLVRAPLPAPGGGDGTPVTLGDLFGATLLFLSVPTFAPGYPAALQAAARGDGAPLRTLSVELETDVDGTSLVGPEWAITCEDSSRHPSGAELGALTRGLAVRFPLAGAMTPTYLAAGCTHWPAPADPVTTVAPHAGPTALVIGNTGDPNTPHLAAVQLTRALGRAHLLTWEGWGHTWLLNGTHDACMAAAVTRYLVTAVSPRSGTVCP